MKVLFLDVDGVLNMLNSGYRYTINKKRVKELSRVVEETGCKLVLSSTWRRDPEAVTTLLHKLKYRGLNFIDHTTHDYFKLSQTRGDEISLWLQNHQSEIENYAIVDDNFDFLEEQKGHLVLTDSNEGLTHEKANEIISILNKE